LKIFVANHIFVRHGVGALLVTLSVIYFEFKAHHIILQQYAIPTGLGLVGLSFVFQQDNDPTHLHAM
jgi:hypothetical protein